MSVDQTGRDVLFLALTRPAMKWGVPFEGFIANALASFFFGLIAGNPFVWLVGVLIHYPMKLIAAKDPNLFRIGRLWLLTKGRGVGREAWGGSALSPLPSAPPSRSSEAATSV